MAESQTVVIDSGSGSLKAGLAGADQPKLSIPAFIGRPKHTKVMTGGAEGEYHVGNKAAELKGILQLKYPTSHGIVEDWKDMQRIWQAAYNDMGVIQDQHPVLLTEAALNPHNNRAQLAQVFFESFNVPALHVQNQSILSLYASGRITGCVLDSGDGVTCAVPVFQGFALPHATQRSDVAGRDISEYLQQLLRKSGANLYTSAELQIVRNIKETHCRVAFDIQKAEVEEASAAPTVFALPDGQTVSVGAERFRGPEILFNPMLVGSEAAGIHHLLSNAIAKCDMDVRRKMYSEILLSGGSTMFAGFGDRLLAETRLLAPEDNQIKIWAPANRTHTAWVGGSILASLSTFKKMLLTRKEYDEGGQQALYRKQAF